MAPKEEAPPKVVDLMEALRRSLDQVSAGKKKTAKVEDGDRAAGQESRGQGVEVVAAKPAAKKRKAS